MSWRGIAGVVLIIVGVLFGLYVSIVWSLYGGIVDIVHMVSARC
jgi:hypothetical protein